MKKQLVIIHGGDTFNSYEEYIADLKNIKIDLAKLSKKGWKITLAEKLGDEYEVIAPRMPNSMNARYLEWKIFFEKILPLLNENAILLGHSLGGVFLVKYISENKLANKIKALFLLAAPYGDNLPSYSLTDFTLPPSLAGVRDQIPNVYLYHSKDDPVVPFADLELYAKELPGAIKRVFDNLGHFNQEEFPELVEDLQRE